MTREASAHERKGATWIVDRFGSMVGVLIFRLSAFSAEALGATGALV
ncbi:hypothetical protein [Alloprevotella tannerae]|nr:hypothetical protein [Alloprevotella tannerae]